MAKIERFEDLEIWKEVVAIGVDIYSITSAGKLEKDYSSKDQLIWAGMVPENDFDRLHEKRITASKNIKGFIKY